MTQRVDLAVGADGGQLEVVGSADCRRILDVQEVIGPVATGVDRPPAERVIRRGVVLGHRDGAAVDCFDVCDVTVVPIIPLGNRADSGGGVDEVAEVGGTGIPVLGIAHGDARSGITTKRQHVASVVGAVVAVEGLPVTDARSGDIVGVVVFVAMRRVACIDAGRERRTATESGVGLRWPRSCYHRTACDEQSNQEGAEPQQWSAPG